MKNLGSLNEASHGVLESNGEWEGENKNIRASRQVASCMATMAFAQRPTEACAGCASSASAEAGGKAPRVPIPVWREANGRSRAAIKKHPQAG
jgi:hypothetical protein